MERFAVDGIAVDFDPQGGVIDAVTIEVDGQRIAPLHKAPWVKSGERFGPEVAAIEQRLAGDFFCAPFAQSDGDAPIHGWAANGMWKGAGKELGPDGATTAAYELAQTIFGAHLRKEITLVPGHPVVYQTHVFTGGPGLLPVAHHAMVHVPGGAALSFSPKAFARTPATALETDAARGSSLLGYPQQASSLAEIKRLDGGMIGATYPFDRAHEDLVILSEQPGSTLGWSTALAARDGFLFFAVKDAAVLPQTVLWMSNGGRNYAPWNGRHTAVLGIEEGAVSIHLTTAERQSGSSADGLAWGITLREGGSVAVRYAFGAIPVPRGWTEIADVGIGGDALLLTDRSGETRKIPFRTSFFGD